MQKSSFLEAAQIKVLDTLLLDKSKIFPFVSRVWISHNIKLILNYPYLRLHWSFNNPVTWNDDKIYLIIKANFIFIKAAELVLILLLMEDKWKQDPLWMILFHLTFYSWSEVVILFMLKWIYF